MTFLDPKLTVILKKKDLGHNIDGADVVVLPRADFLFLLHKKYMSHGCHLGANLYLCKPSYFRIQCGHGRVNYIYTSSQDRSFTRKATWRANLRASMYIKIFQSWDMFGMKQLKITHSVGMVWMCVLLKLIHWDTSDKVMGIKSRAFGKYLLWESSVPMIMTKVFVGEASDSCLPLPALLSCNEAVLDSFCPVRYSKRLPWKQGGVPREQ